MPFELPEPINGPVDVVVTGVDDSPRYRQAVSWWFKFWQALAPIWPGTLFPVVLKVGDNPTGEWMGIPREHIEHCACPPSIPTAFAAQTIRVLWPSQLPDSVRAVMTTDADMMPLSPRVFAPQFNAPAGAFVVIRDVLQRHRQIPICYNVAAPSTWRRVVGGEPLVPRLERVLAAYGPYEGVHGGQGWSIDQRFLFDSVADFQRHGGNVLRLRDNQTGYRRLDRRYPALVAHLGGLGISRGVWASYHGHLPAERFDHLYGALHSRLVKAVDKRLSA